MWGCLKSFDFIKSNTGTFVCQQWREYMYKIFGVTYVASSSEGKKQKWNDQSDVHLSVHSVGLM